MTSFLFSPELTNVAILILNLAMYQIFIALCIKVKLGSFIQVHS